MFELYIFSWIFNLFFKAIYWILESIHDWSIMHYLNDFFTIFSIHIEFNNLFWIFDDVLVEIDFIKILKKNESDIIIIYFDFQIDINLMKIHFFSNKYIHIIRMIFELVSRKFISQISFEEILDFLSYYCQIISLDHLFQLYNSLIRLFNKNFHHRKSVNSISHFI